MTYCKAYCGDVPPELPDKCEMLKPQLIRIHSGVRKVIKFKMFDTCYDTLETPNVSGRRIINLANRFVANLQRMLDDPSVIRWKIVTPDGRVVYNSRTTIDSNNLFSLSVPALNLNGYYNIVISRRGTSTDSSCSVKLFFCP